MAILTYISYMNYDKAKMIANIFKAVAHPVRLIMVEALSNCDEMTVSELNRLIEIDQSTLSRHLAQLKKAGLVSERRAGSRIYHSLAAPCVLGLCKSAQEVLICRLKKEHQIMQT